MLYKGAIETLGYAILLWRMVYCQLSLDTLACQVSIDVSKRYIYVDILYAREV
jgi:hypothetical protein